MSFDRRLLDILCCPATHMPLRLISDATLARVNAAIAAGSLKHRDDSPVTEPLAQALITDDERLVYPIVDDIPVLLEDRGILTAARNEP